MKLTPQQLEYIRSFISKRGFTALDLQMEIIDHMACRVEDILTENPAVSFKEAVTRTHREFGVFGFSMLEDAMTKSLARKYGGQLLLELKQWFSFPSVLLVGGFAFLLYQLFFVVATNWLIGVFGFIYLALAIGVIAYVPLQIATQAPKNDDYTRYQQFCFPSDHYSPNRAPFF